MTLYVLNVIQPWSQWIVDVNDHDLPIGFFLVKKCHDAEDFDLLDLTWRCNELANFADIKRIIVALSLGLRMDCVRVFPCLSYSQYLGLVLRFQVPYLGKCAVVPEIALVGEAVANVSEFPFLGILLDWI